MYERLLLYKFITQQIGNDTILYIVLALESVTLCEIYATSGEMD